jgi:hypothetical protein
MSNKSAWRAWSLGGPTTRDELGPPKSRQGLKGFETKCRQSVNNVPYATRALAFKYSGSGKKKFASKPRFGSQSKRLTMPIRVA